MCENLGVPTFTGKKVKEDDNFAIKEHYLFYNHSSGFDDFPYESVTRMTLTLMERFLINEDHPPLNKNKHLLPLELCDDWGTYLYHM